MKRLISVIALLTILISLQVGQRAAFAASLPCDIYGAGGTPCIAAHSTVRALYGAYSGRLYQVKRASNGATTDINTLSAGGFANAAAQDSFCAGTTCVITIIYDQSGRGNDLQFQGPGGAGGHDTAANATSESLTVSGHKVYSLYINPGNSYWRNGSTTGVPTGSAPEGMYMVTSGTHVNSGCCFDYGNSEVTRTAAGAGHMDAIYFGTSCWFGGCVGTGPWVQADLEFGLYSGGSQTWNQNQRAFTSKYVTAMLKNNGTTNFAIKGGNAQSGGLTTLWNGALPNGYNPMRKEGAIILGSGGDCCATNTNQSLGTFYEGVMVSGYPSDTTENSVQANIVATYGATSTIPTNTPAPGTFPVAGTQYRLINRNSGKVADVSNRSLADGGDVIQWTSNGGTNQQWSFVATDSGYYRVINRNSGKVLDVAGVSTADGANVYQWTWLSGSNQQWKVNNLGNGYYSLIARHSGKALDVNGCSTADGGNIQQWTWLNNNCQQWQIVP